MKTILLFWAPESSTTSIEHVNLWYTQLTKQQLEEIFTAICVGPSQLTSMDLQSTQTSSVDAGLLARAVNRLEEVVLHNTQLSKQQAEAFLTESLLKTSLRKLDLRFAYVFDVFDVLDKELVARTRLAIRSLIA